jgi:hypothetical protein
MESKLDEFIKTIEAQKQSLKKDQSYAQYAYVTHEDFQKKW